MFKRVLLVFIIILLSSCKKHDAAYFITNPQDLQTKAQSCQEADLYKITCADLQVLASEMNSLVYDLQLNPQNFGIKILKLQIDIASKQSSNQDVSKLKRILALRLALVKWLESPES